jgi:hypothetical protein
LSARLLPKNLNIKINITTTVPTLYGCGTWSLTLRGEHRWSVFEKTELGGIFGPKREEVEGGWRRVRNEELHNFYTSPIIIIIIVVIIRLIKTKSMRWAGYVLPMGEVRNA